MENMNNDMPNEAVDVLNMTDEELGLSSDTIGELALGLLNRLDDNERRQLEEIITPQAAQLLAKAFGPQFWPLLSPLLQDDEPEDRQMAEDELRSIMRDPRYWRDRDGELVRKVSDGFRRLYPE